MENTKKINLPYNVKDLLKILNKRGYEAYTVGGAVRDNFLGLEVHDYDITTNATPQEVCEVFKNYRIIETGLKHGTVTVIYFGVPYEITTYRVDGEYEDNRHPKSVQFSTDLYDDLSRRDFTINALACDMNGNIVDYFGGIADLKKKEIKCVGNPEDRFKEDALRILRALRFASKLGFTIEQKTSESIHKLKYLLKNISAERIQKEFNGILLGQNAKTILREYKDVFEEFMPTLHLMDLKQNNRYHKHDTVYEHTIHVCENIRQDTILRLAAFFHDFGKPLCYTEEIVDGEVRGHFYGHPSVSEKITRLIMKDLKYSNAEIETVCWLVLNHDYQLAETTKSVKKLLNKAPTIELFDLLLELREADRKDHVYPEGETFASIEKIKAVKEEIIAEQECFSLKDLAVNGYDMMTLGCEGIEIGDALNFLLEAVINEKVENKKETLVKYLTCNLSKYLNRKEGDEDDK